VTVTTGIELVSIAITAADNYISGGSVPTADAVYPTGGYNLQLKAEGTYSDGSKADITNDVAWSLVGTTTYGTVNAAGVFTTGTVTTAQVQEVKAALSGIEGTFDIGIVPGAITTIAIVDTDGSSPTTSVSLGSSTNYAAQITITGGSVYWATMNVTWASSATTIGTIVASGADAGKFTAIGVGVTNISANRGTASSGPVAITVGPKVPSKVWCEPKTGVSLVVGGTAQLKAYVQFTDGSSQEITTDTTNTSWATADNTKVDFVNSGTLPGLIVGKGTTTGVYITPTYDTATDPAVSATGTDRCLVVVQ
jgi:hypothetical protein